MQGTELRLFLGKAFPKNKHLPHKSRMTTSISSEAGWNHKKYIWKRKRLKKERDIQGNTKP